MTLRQIDTSALDEISDDSPVANNVARVLSLTARGGVAWLGCTWVLSRVGPQYQRAGVEGFTAWALAETAAAGLKAVTDRPRPAGDNDTNSSSMPSAHTAAAVAYAVAAGARAPIAGIPLGALASAVSWSRLSTRRHFPTDVAAGTFLGVAVGTAVAVLSRRSRAANAVASLVLRRA